eukprot:2533173-Rhodomonas_salina.1
MELQYQVGYAAMRSGTRIPVQLGLGCYARTHFHLDLLLRPLHELSSVLCLGLGQLGLCHPKRAHENQNLSTVLDQGCDFLHLISHLSSRAKLSTGVGPPSISASDSA